MDVSALPVARNLPSGLNLAHLATFYKNIHNSEYSRLLI